MKKLIVITLAFIQTAFGASVNENYLAPVEYKSFKVNVHHADCVSSIRITPTLKIATCNTKVRLPQATNFFDSIMMKSTYPNTVQLIRNNVAKFYILREDLACTAEVEIRPQGNGTELGVKFKFTKLTNSTHASVVMCSKRLIEKYSKGNSRQMAFEFTAMVPSL
jgi:hypothetical protein